MCPVRNVTYVSSRSAFASFVSSRAEFARNFRTPENHAIPPVCDHLASDRGSSHALILDCVGSCERALTPCTNLDYVPLQPNRWVR
jgi:hypothetical protein